MSRRKVRGLTRTGRQVSEDPDLDNLLSNMSPEEIEELEKEVMTVPDPNPNEVDVVDQTNRNTANNRDAELDLRESKSNKCIQRDLSVEGEPKKESRKQEYLRKMGLSQERRLSRSDSRDGGIQRQDSIPAKQENKAEDRNCEAPEESKEDRTGPSHRYRREESKDNQRKAESKEKERTNESNEKREIKENSNSKTKDLISKLQEKKEESKEKDRREESRKRESGDSKTKGLISKLQEKRENEECKERERKEDTRKREDSKIKGLMSKMEEKQNPVAESKTGDKKRGEEKDKLDGQLQSPEEERKKEGESKSGEEKQKGAEREEKNNANVKVDRSQNASTNDKVEEKDKDEKEKSKPHKLNKEEMGNCVADKSSKSKTKEEQEEDESSSMFDETLEKVRSDDPEMTELNVNNSEVIKIKTLIEFAEALRDNTHVKAFALANCRADDHIAYAIAGTLRNNKTITSINLDSNHLTSKGITALVQALRQNSSLTELRFHNQRHICGGKTEMEMAKVLKENTTLLKLGYHFELAGPRMTMTNILSRNMDRQRQRRLQEQKQAQAQGNGDKKGSLEVPKAGGGFRSPKASPKPSPMQSPMPSPKLTPKKAGRPPPPGAPPPPPPPPGAPPPPPPMLDVDSLRNSLTPVSQRKLDCKGAGAGGKNSRDQLLSSIRTSNLKQLKKVAVPKLLQ